ncbi:MAG: hypothetical protein F4213_21130 [Boseongicola sp. SB0677_bin_26]|nr:hypothetical protein [Boseongicola sp. SB0665_bin_10]MYG28487.1 hypothetical protein [Boseongicola sp. SB0677_bin_26]
MNSNLKLLPAALLVSVLALAGCGGGSGSDGDMDDMMPEMTEAQKCAAKGQGYTLDDEDMCVNVDDAVDKAYEDGKEKGAEEEGMKRDKAADDQKMSDDMKAARQLAAKLYSAIGPTSFEETSSAGSPAGIAVTAVTDAGKATAMVAAQALKRGAMQANLGNWNGYDYAATKQTARLYTTTGAATPGGKFSSTTDGADLGTPNGDGEYTLSTSGPRTTVAQLQSRTKITAFTQTSGSHTFKPIRNLVTQAGSYWGVPGTYYCSGTDCSATVTSNGVQLGGTNSWTFKPTDPNQMVMETAGDRYAFGWWLNESGSSPSVTAFATHDASQDLEISGLRGKATYKGAAAGKYALHHDTTGGASDAGNFTADAELTAEFDAAHTISGTIDNFMGDDGKTRDWKVTLDSISVAATGIAAPAATDGDLNNGNEAMTTTWTIGEDAASAAGSWSGQMHGNHKSSGTPEAVTGVFNAGYNNVGRMEGAFGTTHE